MSAGKITGVSIGFISVIRAFVAWRWNPDSYINPAHKAYAAHARRRRGRAMRALSHIEGQLNRLPF